MIHDFDRSGYIGASDVRYVCGAWKGKSFENWWLEKLGVRQNRYQNRYMQAGTAWEHRILEALQVPGLEMDSQFIREELKLRVNLDGNTRDKIYEVKTYRLKNGFHPDKWHRCQVLVQMLGSGIRQGEILYYGLREQDYSTLGAVDGNRIHRVVVDFDLAWLNQVYLPRHRELVRCMVERVFPPVWEREKGEKI